MKDYTQLRELLKEQETFPLDFTVKFIGKNSVHFKTGVSQFVSEYPGIQEVSRRPSSQGAHLALTYLYRAPDVEAVIRVLERVSQIEDVQVVL